MITHRSIYILLPISLVMLLGSVSLFVHVFLYMTAVSTVELSIPFRMNTTTIQGSLPFSHHIDCRYTHTVILKLGIMETEEVLDSGMYTIETTINGVYIVRTLPFPTNSRIIWWMNKIIRIPSLLFGIYVESTWRDVVLFLSYTCEHYTETCSMSDPYNIHPLKMGEFILYTKKDTFPHMTGIRLTYISNFSNGVVYYIHYYKGVTMGILIGQFVIIVFMTICMGCIFLVSRLFAIKIPT